MNRKTRCGGCSGSSSPGITLKEVTSVLTTDYEELQNKPAINGVTLTSSSTADDLHLYSTIPDDHETLTLTTATEGKMSILLLSDSGETAKVSLEDVLNEGTTIQTVDDIDDPAIMVGNYMFLKIND